MDYICYAKKKNGELCNTKLTDKNKNEVNIENNIYFVCGRHKKINNINDIDKSKYDFIDKKDISNENTNIIDDFNEKLNISKNNEKKEDNKKIKNIDKNIRKKPCLQHIIYLISKDNDDTCQFDDCQFAHNIDIIYTD